MPPQGLFKGMRAKPRTSPRQYLTELALDWEQRSRRDARDLYPYSSLVDEILFHADLRFDEYIQYRRKEGRFPTRLKQWLDNVQADRERQALVKLAGLITFVDRKQMRSLCRDAYRRIIAPWISDGQFSPDDYFSADYEARVQELLRQYRLYSITESFSFPDFLHENDLSGLPHPTIFGEDPRRVKLLLPPSAASVKGLIVFEDFVGTGNQATAVLAEVGSQAPKTWRILFVPLIALESGLTTMTTDPTLQDLVAVRPVLMVDTTSCLLEEPQPNEPSEFPYIRAVIKATARRVLRRLSQSDDPPTDAFGYRGSGALLVTHHNTPNNTLPIIHHRAPDWNPLFRRVHHSREGLR